MDLTIILMNGQSTTLRVPLEATVGSLKSLITQRFTVPAATQKLSYVNGQNISLSDDSRLLRSYGLTSGSQVCVLITEPAVIVTQVFLRNEKGQTKTFDIRPGETVREFKVKVKARESVPVEQQSLIHEGKCMEDHLRLEDYNVQKGSTIYLTMRLRGG
ncbi:ubiquitin-like protein ISG15 [Diretmus argenteus]